MLKLDRDLPRRNFFTPRKRLCLALTLGLVSTLVSCAINRRSESSEATLDTGLVQIDRTKPLCPQLQAAAEAAIDSLVEKDKAPRCRKYASFYDDPAKRAHAEAECRRNFREWAFDYLPRVDCWSVEDMHKSKLPDSHVWSWNPYEDYSGRAVDRNLNGIAVLGMIEIDPVHPFDSNIPMPDVVRQWRDELVRRGFNPRVEKWDLKHLYVFRCEDTRFGGDQVCAIYSHRSDLVDYTDLEAPLDCEEGQTYRESRAAIRRAGELCQEPTLEEREERRRSQAEYRRMCNEGELSPDLCD